MNAFDQCWEGECNWMVPPPRLIVLCLSKLKHDRACGTLVVPEWFSAPFWVQLVDTNGVFQHFVKDFRYISRYCDIKQGRGNNGVFARKPLFFRMLALKISYS